MSNLDLSSLVESWETHLRAERKAAATIKNYLTAVRQFLAWCQENDLPPKLDRTTVNGFVADLLDSGAEPSTALSRQLGVKRFSAWLVDEGELDRDELIGIKPPKLDKKVVEPLTVDELQAMLKACQGRELRDRRDEAILRFMLETGARASETAELTVSGTNVREGAALIRRGKGGKGRIVPFGPQTGRALDRYLRLRKTHVLADSDRLWLGRQGKLLNYSGLYETLRYRAEVAGVEGFHPHKLRHTAASRWLAAGGSEGGLMAVAGWSHRALLDRYVQATAAERAAGEARGLNLGDL